jgi:hypothetical protein
MHNEKRKNRYAGYVRQYVALIGLDLDDFNNALGGFMRVHRYFQDTLSTDRLERSEPLSIDGSLAFASHTRYFSARRNCRSTLPMPFGAGVDPNGDLERIGGASYVHTEDNVVQYLGRKHDDEGSWM